MLQYFKGNLQYNQGFHNIGAIFLLTHGKISLTMSTLKMVASLYLRETMQPNFEMLKEGVELFYPKSPGFPIKSIILQKICLITIATHCYTLNNNYRQIKKRYDINTNYLTCPFVYIVFPKSNRNRVPWYPEFLIDTYHNITKPESTLSSNGQAWKEAPFTDV